MTPYYADDDVTVHHGDCLDVLAEFADASIDAVVTDPPYSLGFMGQAWDEHAGPAAFEEWCRRWAAECLRVLKPGGHVLAFGGSRTWHRLTSGIEAAGFEIRDNIAWLYGSGFPKSLDLSKAIDRQRDDRADVLRVTGWLRQQRDRAGVTNRQIDALFGFDGMANHWVALEHNKVAELPTWEQWQKLRELIGFGDEMDAEVWRLNGRKGTPGEAWDRREVIGQTSAAIYTPGDGTRYTVGGSHAVTVDITAPATESARRWQGWGTALKPAFEPIVVARKPLVGTVAANVTQYGTGALNIDGCRVPTSDDLNGCAYAKNGARSRSASLSPTGMNVPGKTVDREFEQPPGRWPTNVVLDADQAAELDAQSGVSVSRSGGKTTNALGVMNDDAWTAKDLPRTGHDDEGGASRFFPVFKYTAKAGTGERPEVDGVRHPTVKPLDLMRWLVRLVTPPGGLVLDPFAGSGTTAEACILEGFRCVTIEREASYLPLIRARLGKPMQPGLFGSAS